MNGASASETDAGGGRRRGVLAGLLLAALVTATFSSTFGNAWIWDDDEYVTQNPQLLDGAGLVRIWTDRSATPQYYPVVHTSFWLERRVWGTEVRPDGSESPRAFGHHLDNVLLHAAGAIVLWRLLRRFGLRWAWWAAALWAVHPVTVESVAWVSERKNVLSLLFALLATHAFWDAVEREEAGPRARRLGLAAAWFTAALLSKSVVASLPAVWLLLLWWQRRPARLASLAPLAGMLAFGAWIGWMTAQDERTQVGAEGAPWDLSWVERGLVAGKSLWHYAATLVWPVDLGFVYERWEPDASDPLAWAALVTALALPIGLFLLRNRLGRGPLVAVLVFGGVLFPALGFLNVYPHVYSWVADHFQHHASVALVALLVVALFRAPPFRSDARRVGAVGGVLLVVLGALSHVQGRAYRDQETLWTHTVERNPKAAIAWNNLGVLAMNDVDEAGVAKEPNRALALESFLRGAEAQPYLAEGRSNAGQMLMLDGQHGAAEEHLRAAVEWAPTHSKPWLLLGEWLSTDGQYDEAVAAFERSMELAGRRDPTPLALLAFAHLSVGRVGDAIDAFEEALAAGNTNPWIRTQLARAYVLDLRPEQARPHFEEALRVAETRAVAARHLVWLLTTHEDASVREPARALALATEATPDPSRARPLALQTLALAHAANGDFARATELALAALERAGADDANRRASLERHLASYGREEVPRSRFGAPD